MKRKKKDEKEILEELQEEAEIDEESDIPVHEKFVKEKKTKCYKE